MWALTKFLSGCAVAIAIAWAFGSVTSTHAQESSVEEKLHVHRFDANHTSPYDAFAHLNRISKAPSEIETPADYAGNIVFSRLSNIEGRIQLKVVPGFDRAAYLGYKTFLRAWPEYEGLAVGNCVVCHTPPEFSDSASHVVDLSGEAKPTPTLRNLEKSPEELRAILLEKVRMAEKARAGEGDIDEAYKLIELNEEAIEQLVAFLQSLTDVPDEEFRDIAVNATILDTSDLL